MKKLINIILLFATILIFQNCASVNPLLNPKSEAGVKAPEKFTVIFTTSKGDVTIDIKRDLSPKGVDRFYYLAKNNYYNFTRFFRVVPNFVVQWGISGNPILNELWGENGIEDEPVKASNVRGAISFARGGPNTRSNQLFINLKDNKRLDKTKFMDVEGFPVFGNVVSGMEAIDSIYSGYREQPDQDSIQTKGSVYLRKSFPKLDYIISTKIIE